MAVIDQAIIEKVIEVRLATLHSATLHAHVGPGRPEPTIGSNCASYFKRTRADVKRLRRSNPVGADVATIEVEVVLVVGENHMRNVGAYSAASLAALIATTMDASAMRDASTNHVVTLNDWRVNDLPAPDEQPGLTVKRVLLTGTAVRSDGTGLVSFPEVPA